MVRTLSWPNVAFSKGIVLLWAKIKILNLNFRQICFSFSLCIFFSDDNLNIHIQIHLLTLGLFLKNNRYSIGKEGRLMGAVWPPNALTVFTFHTLLYFHHHHKCKPTCNSSIFLFKLNNNHITSLQDGKEHSSPQP